MGLISSGALILVSFGIVVPLHRRRINTHGRFANNFEISRHAGETVLPSRRTTNLPWESVSMILAALATFIGPADIARAILNFVGTSPVVADL
jgi:hypothetical protein